MKRFCILMALAATAPAQASEQPTPAYPFQRSVLTTRFVAIAPYREVFNVRAYNTPPRQPFYNVPPYAVVSPY